MTDQKLTSFNFGNNELAVSFVETMIVKEGVECDVYKFVGDESKDLAIVRVKQGSKTPLQKILKGDKTIEGFVDGEGTLTIQKINGDNQSHTFSKSDSGELEVSVGEIMQWHADGDTDLTFYEICWPPYEDGRFENLADKTTDG